MDDNARPHQGRAVIAHLRNNAVETLPWPTRSPDLDPIEHLWDYLGHEVQARDSSVRNLQELEQTLYEEWQRITRLIASMRRRHTYDHTCAARILQILMHLYSMYTHYSKTFKLPTKVSDFFLLYFCECQERHFWRIRVILLIKCHPYLNCPSFLFQSPAHMLIVT